MPSTPRPPSTPWPNGAWFRPVTPWSRPSRPHACPVLRRWLTMRQSLLPCPAWDTPQQARPPGPGAPSGAPLPLDELCALAGCGEGSVGELAVRGWAQITAPRRLVVPCRAPGRPSSAVRHGRPLPWPLWSGTATGRTGCAVARIGRIGCCSARAGAEGVAPADRGAPLVC